MIFFENFCYTVFLKYYNILLYFQLFLPQKQLRIQNIQQLQLFLPQKWLKIPKNRLKKLLEKFIVFRKKIVDNFLEVFFGGKKNLWKFPHNFFWVSKKSYTIGLTIFFPNPENQQFDAVFDVICLALSPTATCGQSLA